MNRETLLKRVKQTVQEVEPGAQIILYGSRSRNDANPESDWDFVVLIDGLVNDELTDTICHKLYEIEWEHGEVLCAIVRNRTEWDSPLYKAMPFRQNVVRDGIVI